MPWRIDLGGETQRLIWWHFSARQPARHAHARLLAPLADAHPRTGERSSAVELRCSTQTNEYVRKDRLSNLRIWCSIVRIPLIALSPPNLI